MPTKATLPDAKVPPTVIEEWLAYADRLDVRSLDDIQLIVIHCTELPDIQEAREYADRIHYPSSGTGNSGHYYVDRDGTLYRWVPEDRIAHHVRGYNAQSVGIELVNRGRYPDWHHSQNQKPIEPYPQAQIAALIVLMADIVRRLPRVRHVVGHADLDVDWVAATDDASVRVRRKIDPGPHFPWNHVLRHTRLRRYAP